MTNYISSCRSNYFEVKDAQAFKKEMESVPEVEVEMSGTWPNVFCLFVVHHDGAGWPVYKYNEVTDKWDEFNIFNTVARHLVDGEVAVFMEVGSEKLRYLIGYALAINNKLESREISLYDIYKIAQDELADNGRTVTLAEY